MADRKITDLTALAAGSQATGDLLTIVDVSEGAAADKNKKMTMENLFKGIPGDVGIGTSSPGAKLSIEEKTYVGAGFIRFLDNASSQTGTAMWRPASDTLAFNTNSTERLRIDSSGRLLVGTSTARANFVVGLGSNTVPAAGAATASALFSNGTGVGDYGLIAGATSSGHGYLQAQRADGIATTYDLFVQPNGGNVGIGTSSPLTRCHLDGTSGNDSTFFLSASNLAANAGGILSLGGNYDGTNRTSFAQVKGLKENATSGQYGGYLSFSTRPNGSSHIERMRIDSSGRVGIGTSSPDSTLEIAAGPPRLKLTRKTTASTGNDFGRIVFENSVGTEVSRIDSTSTSGNTTPVLRFSNNGSERMRIDSSGRLGLGTSSPVRTFHNANDICLTTGSTPQYRLNGGAGDSNDNDRAIFGLATANNHFFGTAVAGDAILRTTNGGNLLLGAGTTERMRIDSTGNLLVGKTSQNLATTGFQVRADAPGLAQITTSAQSVLDVNRLSTDGVIVNIRQNTTVEGTISVSGSTVSYNGGHLARWSQLAGGAERTEILRGSVLSNLNEMCEWGEEDNEQLNRMKVSDVEGDPNVAGVFQAWDDDDDTYTNDFYCAMTGDFIIRIAQGTTVARGDLLMSAGDGTAKPQDDDIIRSKTIAKVTSTHVSETYADGSYCVPCVLMAC